MLETIDVEIMKVIKAIALKTLDVMLPIIVAELVGMYERWRKGDKPETSSPIIEVKEEVNNEPS